MRGRKYLYRRFKRFGFRFIPSQANFVLLDTERDADEVFQAFLREGVIIRSMKAYGLATWIRVTVGRRSQNARFIRILKKFRTEGRSLS